MDRNALRAELASGHTHAALARLRIALDAGLSRADAAFAREAFAPLRRTPPQTLARMRIAILSTFTIDPLLPWLELHGLANRIAIETWIAPYDQIDKSTLDDASELWSFDPQLICIAADGADLAPDLYHRFPDARAQGRVDAMLDAAIARIHGWIAAIRTRTEAPILLHGWLHPGRAALGIFDATRADGQTAVIEQASSCLREIARKDGATFLLDLAPLVAEVGLERWCDPRMWHAARMRIGPGALPRLARAWTDIVRALAGRQRKCLVLDLDNTLWSGVLGEEGPEGIRMDDSLPGAAHRSLQAVALSLHDRGVVLAISSRNDVDHALCVIDDHPDMILRREHLACWRIDWGDKVEHLRSIANDLGLSTEQLVFLDDHPAERARVRSQLPEVLVPELTSDPSQWADQLQALGDFDAPSFSTEDRERTRLYRQEFERRHLQRETPTLESFHAELAMHLAIRVDAADDVPRLAQLSQRTNQFNLTGARYVDGELARRIEDPSARVVSVRYRDRFGDAGLVGAAVLRIDDTAWSIEAMLLSCRVLGRTIEQALLAWIARTARGAGARQLHARYIRTPRNNAAAGFYPECGFAAVGDDAWELTLQATLPQIPAWVRVED